MSKVTYIYEPEYVCSTLDYIRRMSKTGDYSQLPAIVERLQHHFDRMESGLGKRWEVHRVITNENWTDKKKLKKIDNLFKVEE